MFHSRSQGSIIRHIINPAVSSLSRYECEIIRKIWDRSEDRPLKKDKDYFLSHPRGDQETYRFACDIKLIDINPLKMLPLHRKILFQAFSEINFQLVYKKDQLYLLKPLSQTVATFFQLTHDLVFRHCNSLGKYPGEDRFEIISNAPALGSGTFGKVAAVEGTLFECDEEVHSKVKMIGSRRIVKVLLCKDERDMDAVKKEYRLSHAAGHLHVKEPTFFDAGHESKAYMVMRRMEGVTLHTILHDSTNGIDSFSTEKRIDLSIAILKALANQVHAKRIIHKDIKTNNIMVYEENGQFYVNIIDFGISETFDENRKITEIEQFPYVAPELRASVLAINHYKSDIYSIARIIAEIFGFETHLISAAKLWKEFDDGFCLDGLFKNVFDISDQGKERIRILLSGLGHPVLDKRWSIEDGIIDLKDIKAKEVAVPRLKHTSSRRFILC